MILPALLAGACAALSAGAAEPAPEEKLRILLAQVQRQHSQAVRQTVLGSAEDLRDAVASKSGPAQRGVINHLPGMSADPFNLCRDLRRCPGAPLSLHVEDPNLINDAFIAMARPWFNLQKARGKAVEVKVDAGLGVQLKLQDLPRQEVVTLEAAPAPTGGFDISLLEGSEAALVYARERAALTEEN